MNQHLEEEQQVREMIRKILSESRPEKKLLKEEEANLYSTFVGPFVDVVNSVKLSGLDILNVLKLQFDVITTLSPAKQKAAMEAYDSRKAEIAKAWEPIEARNSAAFSDHAAPLAFMLAPQLALGAAAGVKGAQAPTNIVNYLDDAGWRLPLAGMIPGVQYDSMKDTKGTSGKTRSTASKAKDRGGLISTLKNTAKEMADIFFITHYAPAGPLLAEKKSDKPGPPWGIDGYEDKVDDMKPMSNSEFEKGLDEYLEESGITKELAKQAAAFIDNKKKHIEELLEAGEQQLAMVQSLGSATNLEDFGAALEEAKQLGLEVGDTASVAPSIEEAAQTLVGEEEFIEQVRQEKNLKPEDEIPEEELLESAKTVVFMEAKKDIQAQLEEGLPTLKEQLKEAIMLDVPVKGEKNFKAVSSTETGREYFKMIEAAIAQVDDYKIEA